MRPSDLLESEAHMAGTSVVGLRSPFIPQANSKHSDDVSSLSPPPISFDVTAYTRILQQMTKLYPYDPAAVAASISALGHTSHLPLAFTVSSVLAPSNGTVSPSEGTNADGSRVVKNVSKIKENVLCLKAEDQGIDRALDLSTQGLKSLYSQYQRISLSQIKPKIVEDVWVENDVVLTWTDSKVAAYNPAQKLFMCVDCESVGFLSRVAEHWLGAHANLRVFHCPRCPYTSAWSRCVKMHLTRQHNEQFADTTMWKENAALMEVTKLMQELRTKVETKIDASNTLSDKRFYCPHCPYATDRRDLYTRHENIHKDNKPFHCYLCFKQFNRADHVKKHFVRMHPDSDYDISKIRKQPTNSKTQPAPESTSAQTSTPLLSTTSKPITTSPSAWEQTLQPSALPLIHKPVREYDNSPLSSKDPTELQTVSSTINYTTEPVTEISIVDVPSTCSPLRGASTPTLKPFIKSPVTEVSTKSRRRGDRAYTCHYCHWSGTDNWCLKRHMNTHIKPFACIMCDYKAARAERLSTHVWKVHNKRICNKCNFLADTQERLLEHTREEHHNNPYSRRHICACCGMSFDTRANLQTHIHLAHTGPKSPADVAQITPITIPEKVQDIAQDLTVSQHLQGEEVLSLICPIEECSKPCQSSGILADHVRLEHGGLFASRCPHCSYSLTQDELAKDHWLTHHEDVCNACVHVFTSVYGPQLWKKVHFKVHVRPQLSESPLNAIVNGLNKRKNEPDLTNMLTSEGDSQPSNDSTSLQSFPSSPASESPEYDVERLTKRSRKQSCPKKVITMNSESTEVSVETKPDVSSLLRNRKLLLRKKLRKKCLHCPHRPKFSSFARLRVHKRLKHKLKLKRKKSLKRISLDRI